MISGVRTDIKFPLWEKPKYDGFFHVEWLQVKDVPNYVLTTIKMSNTPTKKSITSCRDCEEVLFEEVLRKSFMSFTSYSHYSTTRPISSFKFFLHIQVQRVDGMILRTLMISNDC